MDIWVGLNGCVMVTLVSALEKRDWGQWEGAAAQGTEMCHAQALLSGPFPQYENLHPALGSHHRKDVELLE